MTSIYQSSWMKPYLRDELEKGGNDIDGSRAVGGWPEKRYYYVSWTLSALRLTKHYQNVTLVCDEASKKMLIDKLELPYTDVICKLDTLDTYPAALWAVGKLFTYKIAKIPFIHVDSDVFIWDALPQFSNDINQFIFQNFEYQHEYYNASLAEIEKYFRYIPSGIQDFFKTSRKVKSINAGIWGTNSVAFRDRFTDIAFEFIHKNQDLLTRVDTRRFNVIFEQFLSYLVAKESKIDLSPKFKIKKTATGILDVALDNFMHVPSKVQYIHLLGDLKKRRHLCYQMEQRLQYEFPQNYKRLNDLMKKELL